MRCRKSISDSFLSSCRIMNELAINFIFHRTQNSKQSTEFPFLDRETSQYINLSLSRTDFLATLVHCGCSQPCPILVRVRQGAWVSVMFRVHYRRRCELIFTKNITENLNFCHNFIERWKNSFSSILAQVWSLNNWKSLKNA